MVGRRLLPLIVILSGLLGLGFATVGAQEEALTFALVSHGGPEIPFWGPVIQGMEDACALLDAECHWLSDPAFGGFDVMADYWAEALALEPDGIGTSGIAPDVIRDGVEQAADQGIPVVTFNVDDPNTGTDEALPILFYVGPDEFAASVSNGRRVLAEAEADGVTIHRGVCLNPYPEFTPIAARCAGARSVFEEAGIPFDLPEIDPDHALSAPQIDAYFAEHPDTNAVFLTGPGEVLMLVNYLGRTGAEPSQFYSATHDVVPEILDLIRDGHMVQSVGQQPYMQGFQTVMSLYLASQFGIRPSGSIYTNAVIDLSNVEDASAVWEAGYR